MGLSDYFGGKEEKEDELEGFEEEYDDLPELEEDPAPARLAETPKETKKKSVKIPTSPPKVTAAIKRQIKDTIVFMLTMTGGTVSMRDQHCGGLVLQQAEPIADALVPIICRNATMLVWFTTGGNYMDYMALIMAMAPIAGGVVSHHITKTVGHDHEEDEYGDYNFSAPAFA